MLKKSDYNYSLKNIPIPNKDNYLKHIISSTETFIQNLRWKVFHFLYPKPKKNKEEINYFGFKTPKNAPFIPQLQHFENDLNHLISTIDFDEKKNKNKFQQTLQQDVSKINKSKNLFINADKTSNIYEVDFKTYDKLMIDNISSNYKKVDKTIVDDINKEALDLTAELKIADRVEIPPKKDAYITLKDHKDDFPNKIKCRLINPTKSNIGKISKQMIDKINNKIKENIDIKQLGNTDDAIQFFNDIENKDDKLFLICDIVDFYPSITIELFEKTLAFAKQFVNITNLEERVLRNARKSVLYYNDDVWIKKTGLFDVTMGAFDGAQISDLVGLYILHEIKKQIPELQFALYRDDGIGYHKKCRPQFIDKIRKKLYKVFKDIGLNITVETSLTKVNFLDVTFNMNNNTFEIYRKPNDKPLYINRNSNHPPHVLNNVPISINKRLVNISANEELFQKHIDEYQLALKKSSFNHKLDYFHPCIIDDKNNSNQMNRSQTDVKTINYFDNSRNNLSQTIPKDIEARNNFDSQQTYVKEVDLLDDESQTCIKSFDITSDSYIRRSQRIKNKRTQINYSDNKEKKDSECNYDSQQTYVKSVKSNNVYETTKKCVYKNQNRSNIDMSGSQTYLKSIDKPRISPTRRSQRIMNNNYNTNKNMSQKCMKNTPSTTHKDKAMNMNMNIKNEPKRKRNRNKKVVFWNPPFNNNIKNKVGKQFLELIDKHFPNNNDLSSIINKHTVKIAYATTKNMGQIIVAHNRKIINKNKNNSDANCADQSQDECNCRKKCPLPGKCRVKNVVYKAEIKNVTYIGMTSTEFRGRVRRHKHSFITESKLNETTLSKYIWDKELNRDETDDIIEPVVKWSILKECSVYRPGNINCDLCLTEKLFIIKNSMNPRTINKKQDISNKCIHKKLYYYKKLDDSDDFSDII